MLPVIAIVKPAESLDKCNFQLLSGSGENIFTQWLNEGVVCQVAQ